MTRFGELATLAGQLAGEASRLSKRAAIAAALARIAAGPDAFTAAPLQPAPLQPAEQPSAAGPDGSTAASLLQPAQEASGALADAGLFCLYLAGQPFPEADPRKLNAGGALLTRALKQVSGCKDADLTAAYRRHGDLGAAAYDLLAPPYGHAPAESTLTLHEISHAFHAMAAARSTAVRAGLVEGLLRRATAAEAMYLLKLMLNDMRIGVKQSLIEEAIAVAATTAGAAGASGSVAVDVAAVRHAVMLEADLGRAAVMAFSGTLATARMRLFHPLGFMLASPVETPEEAVERFTEKPKPEKPKPGTAAAGKSSRRKRGSEPEIVPEPANLIQPAPLTGPADPEAVLAPDAAELGYAEDVEASTPEMPPAASVPLPLQAFLEDKYDGMRAQLHYQVNAPDAQVEASDAPGTTAAAPTGAGGPRVALYSRNREDITESFPEIVEAFRSAAAAVAGLPQRPDLPDSVPASLTPEPTLPHAIILDGELLGWDFAEGKALPFSILGQRIGRKRVDNLMRQQVPVIFVAFDLLFHNGELLLPRPLRERRERLEELVAGLQPVATAPLKLAPAAPSPHAGASSLQHGLFAAIPEFPVSQELPAGSERPASPGPAELPLPRLRLSTATLVESAEAIDRAYADARARANEGVMLKAAGSAYLPGRRGLAWLKLKRELATLDVVITGAEFGHGRRAQLLSDYTFAVRGPEGELLNVGKAYSGVTDAEIVELTEWLQLHTLEDHGYFRTVEPLRVLEVAFNNVMRSSRHSSGFALRFPRILRIRDDKPVAEIDTLERVEEIYQSQPDKGAE